MKDSYQKIGLVVVWFSFITSLCWFCVVIIGCNSSNSCSGCGQPQFEAFELPLNRVCPLGFSANEIIDGITGVKEITFKWQDEIESVGTIEIVNKGVTVEYRDYDDIGLCERGLGMGLHDYPFSYGDVITSCDVMTFNALQVSLKIDNEHTENYSPVICVAEKANEVFCESSLLPISDLSSLQTIYHSSSKDPRTARTFSRYGVHIKIIIRDGIQDGTIIIIGEPEDSNSNGTPNSSSWLAGCWDLCEYSECMYSSCGSL